jgi:hypothetical protein
MNRIVFGALALVGAGCADVQEAPQPAVPLAVAQQALSISPPSFWPRRPAIQHDNLDGSQDTSGMKLARPEVLDAVLENSFGQTVTAGSTRVITSTYELALGGLNYDPVTVRTEAITPSMNLVMRQLMQHYCTELLADGALSIAGVDVDTDIASVYAQIHSRPIDGNTATDARTLYDAAPTTDAGWQAVCAYLFLIDGSLLLY